MSATPDAEAEEGLQRERTALAWDRTGLAFVLVGAFLFRVVGQPYWHIRHLPAALTVLLGAALVVTAVRGRGWGGERGVPKMRPGLLRLIGAACVALSVACLVAVVRAS